MAGLTSRPGLVSNYGKLPLSFEANLGQTGQGVDFISRGRGYTMFLAGDEAVLSLTKPSAGRDSKIENRIAKSGSLLVTRHSSPAPDVLRMKLVGANAQAAAQGMDKLPGVSNYYIGNDPKKWRTGVPNYAKVHYDDVYPGVDLVYYGNQRQLEYDFVVAPGANPSVIALDFVGAGLVPARGRPQGAPLRIDLAGDLVIATNAGEVRFHKPVVYQPVAGMSPSPVGGRKPVEGKFKLLAENRVGFEIGHYDKSKPLVIDPTLVYSTYFGGAEMDAATVVAVASDGDAVVAGTAGLNDFDETTSGSYGGGFSDAFVAKLNFAGTATEYITYIGGDNGEDVFGIALDGSNNVFITGSTDSSNFPMGTTPAGITDAYISKLNSSGVLQFSKLIGGALSDASSGIAVDGSGNMYIAGPTASDDLTPVNAYQATCASCTTNSTYDSFVAKLNADGSTIDYLSYLGGDSTDYPHGVALSPTSGALWVVGESVSTDFPTTTNGLQQSDPDSGLFNDGFVAGFDTAQTGAASLTYSSYLGGDNDDAGYGIAVDGLGWVHILGSSSSSEAPVGSTGFDSTPNGGQDVVVTKFHPNNNSIQFFGFLGGSGADTPGAIAVDSENVTYVTGNTNSTDFPTVEPIDGSFNTGGSFPLDAFVAKFADDGMSILYSTYLGGGDTDFGSGIAVDAGGNVFVVGQTNSSDFTATAGVIQNSCLGGGSFASCADGFVAKISPATPDGPQITPTPSELAFGDVPLNTPTTMTVSLKNTGNQPLTISAGGIVFVGNLSGGYSIAAAETTCAEATPIAIDATCNIGVTLEATAEGTYIANLKITSDALNSPELFVHLTGTGVGAGLAISPSALNFGDVAVGTPVALALTLTNETASNVTGSDATITGANAADYVIDETASTCAAGVPVAPDASCILTIVFTAGGVGSSSATLTIITDAPNSPHVVPLSGTGVESGAAISVAPANLDFGTAQITSNVTDEVTVTNTGTGNLNLSGMVIGGANASNFALAAGSTCAIGTPVAPDASCTLGVVFTPPAIGTFNGMLTITSNAANSPTVNVPLTGKGSDFSFDVQTGGSTSATVAAGGTATFNLQMEGTVGVTGNAALACSETITDATCSVNPTSVVLNEADPAEFVVSVVTTARTTTTARMLMLPPDSNGRGPQALPMPWVWVLAFSMMMGTLAATRRRARLVLLASMLFVLLWSACGKEPTVVQHGTPAGNYNVTVSATVNGVTKTQTLSVTVN